RFATVRTVFDVVGYPVPASPPCVVGQRPRRQRLAALLHLVHQPLELGLGYLGHQLPAPKLGVRDAKLFRESAHALGPHYLARKGLVVPRGTIAVVSVHAAGSGSSSNGVQSSPRSSAITR